jgi:hypothetical protein
MRAVVASLFVAAVLLGPSPPASASPPDDIAVYCRALHPQMPFQVRCLNLENAAAARVGRVGPGSDPDGWNRCRATTPSWSAMERCLAESARAASTGGGGGGGGAGAGPMERPPAPATAPGATGPGHGGAPAAQPPAAGASPTSTPPAPGAPPSSTVILGPQPTPPLPSERDRKTRPISEADADRHLRSVLERNPSARCTKKQYGPGWVITCE